MFLKNTSNSPPYLFVDTSGSQLSSILSLPTARVLPGGESLASSKERV